MMKLIRTGSSNITELSSSSLWVENLPGATLDDLVTVENGAGESFTGRIIRLEGRGCRVRICDAECPLSKDSLRVWHDSDESGFDFAFSPEQRYKRAVTIFRTGIAPIDALLPVQHGHNLLLAALSLRQAFPLIDALLQGALADHQWPCFIVLNASKNEMTAVHQLWNASGLQGEGLYISESRNSLYQSLAPLRDGLKAAIERADAGQDVFLAVLDVESWFRLHQEDIALRDCWRSRSAALNGFRDLLASHFQLLSGRKGRVTTLALLSERKVAGFPSELISLRDLFDSCLILRRDNTLSLKSWGPQPPLGLDGSLDYARLLRRQCRELYEKIRALQYEEYPITEAQQRYLAAIRAFMGDFTPGAADAHRVWQILSLLPENDITRLPLALLREKSGGERT